METTPNPLKLFISYCHQDKSYLDDLKKHLSPLKIVKPWHDGKLVVGDFLDSEIKKNLLEADLVAFLISPDFLASWYCFEVELKETLGRLENGRVRIIPIIIRSSSWKETILKDYLATPSNGNPIFTSDNPDGSWVEVIDSIKKAANKYNEYKKMNERNISSSVDKLILNPKFLEKLNDTEVKFQHNHKETLFLDDIFVYPDLKNIKTEYDEIEKNINLNKKLSSNDLPQKLLIIGSEQSGKTSLAKMLFKNYHSQNCLPLFCNGIKLNNSNIDKVLSKSISEQYINLTHDDDIVLNSSKILIIDDYHELKINIRFQKIFLKNVFKLIDKLILISDTSIRYNESKYIELSDFSQYEILSLGNTRRGELIEKWNSIGKEETVDIKELHNNNDRITHHVNSIIRKNILPSKPFYILTIIQLLESTTPTDYSLTSYGHCYQSLIHSKLAKSKIKANNFDPYVNYLSEIAYFIFKIGIIAIDETHLNIFKIQYSKTYLVSQSHDEMIKILCNRSQGK